MRERLIHPIEYQMATSPKTVIDLLNEHYDHPATNSVLELPSDREFQYVVHLSVLALNAYSSDAAALAIHAYHFVATVGDMVGYDRRIIKASDEFSSSRSIDELHDTITANTDRYIADNMPTIRLIDTYRDFIDTRDEPDVLSVRFVTATIMRQMQQGNEEYASAREIAALEDLLAAQTGEQPS